MKKAIFSLTIVATWMLTCALLGAAELPPIKPMPEKFKNINIAKPDPALPKEIAGLLGEWEGVWKYAGTSPRQTVGEELRRCRIVVYEVSVNKIKFLLGNGDSPRSKIAGGWNNNESDIRDEWGKKIFSRTTAAGYNQQFHLEDGRIAGEGKSQSIIMNRVK
jgi:hypothetical protein